MFTAREHDYPLGCWQSRSPEIPVTAPLPLVREFATLPGVPWPQRAGIARFDVVL